MTSDLWISTRSRSEIVDITESVQQVVTASGTSEGVCHVYVPHTTAGITINENADPDVSSDLLAALDKLVPWVADYHHVEGNAAAHVKASLVGSSAVIPIHDRRLALGTWQGVFFCEFDGPRRRRVFVGILS